jgi:GNAT superfamily N-acetyltransferase
MPPSRGALFDAAADWARRRGLDTLWGPKGFLAIDGQGLLVEGFEHRAAVGVAYNYPYYGPLLEHVGFRPALDFLSCYMDRQANLPERYLAVAEKVRHRSGLRTAQFPSKRALRAMIPRVAAAYNGAFSEVQGFVPLTEREALAVADRILAIADPTMIKVLLHGDDVAGFVIAYPDLAAAVQRCRGRLWPTGWAHLLREFKRTPWLNFNGIAILPQYRGVGGNALLYAELYASLIGRTQFQYAELVQVQETNTRMVKELEALQVRPFKRHRIYRLALGLRSTPGADKEATRWRPRAQFPSTARLRAASAGPGTYMTSATPPTLRSSC